MTEAHDGLADREQEDQIQGADAIESGPLSADFEDEGDLSEVAGEGLEAADEFEPAEPGPGGFEFGEFVFYPQIGHCEVGDVIEDDATGLELLELTPQESPGGNRILIPVDQVGSRGLRLSGDPEGKIVEVLGSDFEPTIEDASERLDLITAQEREGTVESLTLALKRLHLRHEMKTASREEEKRRARIRKWLVQDYVAENESTSGQAQAAITRLLSTTMKAVREREREAARERRRQERAERKAEAERRRRRRGRN